MAQSTITGIIEVTLAGDTVLDQMVAMMSAQQAATGNPAIYSFELLSAYTNGDPATAWHFLGQNHYLPGNVPTARMSYKPQDRVPLQINDPISPWGMPVIANSTTFPGHNIGAGWRAFEGFGEGNVQLLLGLGGPARAFWDEANDRLMRMGGPTGSLDFAMGLITYDVGNDEFRHWTSGRNEMAEWVCDTTYFSPTFSEFEVIMEPQSIDTNWQQNGYYVGASIDWDPLTALNLKPGTTNVEDDRYITGYTYNAVTGRARITVGVPYQALPNSGDRCRVSDSAASLWPEWGAPHCFGTTAWDFRRRRLYKWQRHSVRQGLEFQLFCMEPDGMVGYPDRASWIAGHTSWIYRLDRTYTFPNLWPQTVYAPNMGPDGSLLITYQHPLSGLIYRIDLTTMNMTTLKSNLALSTVDSGAWSGGTLDQRGVAQIYLDGYLYMGSFNPDKDYADRTYERWIRFQCNNDGTLGDMEILADAPGPMDLGGYSWPGSHTELCGLNGKIYAFNCDRNGTQDPPVPDGGVFCYTPPPVDSWTMVRDSWLVALQNYSTPALNITNSPHNFTVTEIPRLGVFLMVYQYDAFACAAWLFKPPA